MSLRQRWHERAESLVRDFEKRCRQAGCEHALRQACYALWLEGTADGLHLAARAAEGPADALDALMCQMADVDAEAHFELDRMAVHSHSHEPPRYFRIAGEGVDL